MERNKSELNILYIFGFNYSLDLWKTSGSLEREFIFFDELNKRKDVHFTLLTYGDANDFNLINLDNVSVIPIFNYFKKNNSKLLKLIKSIIFPFRVKNNLENIDLIRTNQLSGAWVAIIFKYLLKKPLFLRTGYDAYLFSRENNKYKLNQFLTYLLTNLSLKVSNLYSVSSKSDYKFITENYSFKNKEKLIYRPNWVSQTDFLYDINNRERDFFTVGRLENQKNYLFLIETISNLNLNLDIFGKGSLKNLLQKAADNATSSINFYDHLDHLTLKEIMKKYKIFILPSKFEGNPKVLLEAMSCGCIPIVSNIPNHSEIILNDYNGFLFDLDNKNSLLESINLLIESKNLEYLSLNSFNTIKDNFTLEKSIDYEVEDYKFLV